MGILFTGYIANWKKYTEDEIKIRVARPSPLSPSKTLLNDWKNKLITWDEYEERFVDEIIDSEKAQNKIKEILELLKTNNVRLMCYEKNPPCHRFILRDMIRVLKWGRHIEKIINIGVDIKPID